MRNHNNRLHVCTCQPDSESKQPAGRNGDGRKVGVFFFFGVCIEAGSPETIRQ